LNLFEREFYFLKQFAMGKKMIGKLKKGKMKGIQGMMKQMQGGKIKFR